ncbi:MAG: hypothetical protein SVR94_10880, partial [Pseudomonadota bacterium]|nr:hypothetical protein [Pseudomonadota bacterium]
SIKMGRGPSTPQMVTLNSTGNVNFNFEEIQLTGADATDFNLNPWECGRQPLLSPGQDCRLSVAFTPALDTPPGDKQAMIQILSTAGNRFEIPLTGIAEEAANCSANYITLESVTDGDWQSPETWSESRIPNESDVVHIQHTVVGPAFAKIRALCIAPQASLVSHDFQGTPLDIQIRDYLENNGQIIGRHGADENQDGVCTEPSSVDTPLCAQAGASVLLKVGTEIDKQGKLGDWWWYGNGGPIENNGLIKAGDGGHGQYYGAPGGNAIILGRNTRNQNTIEAGKGGDILGIDNGQGGHGGLSQIWGKLGGPGHLYNQNGARAFAGDGGDCNPEAIAQQIGGDGGNLWLVSLPDVHISGPVGAGRGGQHCAIAGIEGWVRIEPNVIELTGAQTLVEGGDITIYGGRDWTLDLSHLNKTVVDASGDVTLAVGEGGAIDLRGNTQPIIQAQGQVYLFTDTLLVDENQKITDLIQVNNPETDIITAPNRIIYDVSLTTAPKFTGAPGETIPVTFTLMNNGPEADSYTLEGPEWLTEQIPTTVEVEALSLKVLTFEVMLPKTWGATETLNLTAISQTVPSVQSTTDVKLSAIQDDLIVIPDDPITSVIETAPEVVETTKPSVESEAPLNLIEPSVTQSATKFTNESIDLTAILTPITTPPQLPTCPLTGYIDWMCTNHGQVLTDATLGPQANIAGGELAGNIVNHGFISQVTIQPQARVSGGKFSGYIDNQGTLADFEFVGAEVKGGLLSGTIWNNSRVGGTFKNVQLAPNTVIYGGQVQGEIIGDENYPAVLKGVGVRAGSRLVNVEIDLR